MITRLFGRKNLIFWFLSRDKATLIIILVLKIQFEPPKVDLLAIFDNVAVMRDSG